MQHAARSLATKVLVGVGCGIAGCGGVVQERGSAEAGGPGASGPEAGAALGPDAAACFIEATNYDQSCSVDSDCVGTGNGYSIQSGNYCQSMCVNCGRETINRLALAQYQADVAKTPVGSGAIPQEQCSCVMISPPCCANGLCAPSCASVSTTDAALNDAGDAGAVPAGSVMCDLSRGPFDAGLDAAGPWRWCTPPENCVPFNGAWACCTVPSSGGTGACVAPVGRDGGP
jgi:hypothetical protein